MAFEKTDTDATTQGTHQEPDDDDEGGGCLDGEQPNAKEYRCVRSNTIKAIETLMEECVEKQMGECAEMQKEAMRTLFAEFGFKSAGKGSVGEHHGFRHVDKNGLTKAGRAEFRFGKKTVDTVRPDAIFETNSRGLQLVAYAHLETISNLRKRYSRGKAKKLQRNEPADAREDPYIASMLIALAQHQRQLASSREERVGGQRVTVLGIPGRVARELYVYTTRIPEEFLVKLERPSQGSDCDGVVICHHSISLREPQRAAGRLWLALRRNSPIPEDPHQAKQSMREN